MRPMRRCKKPRLDGSSDEEDEEANRIREVVKELPCYQGHALDAFAGKPVDVEKGSGQLEEKQRQLLEERKHLKEEMNKVKAMKIKVEMEKAEVEKDKAKVEEDKVEVEQVRLGIEEERLKLENERVELQKMSKKEEMNKVETGVMKLQMEVDKVQVEQAQLKVDEGIAKLEKERAEVQKLLGELESKIECPVCLTIPREDAPVPCCPQGHFVCSKCFENISRCLDQGFLDKIFFIKLCFFVLETIFNGK